MERKRKRFGKLGCGIALFSRPFPGEMAGPELPSMLGRSQSVDGVIHRLIPIGASLRFLPPMIEAEKVTEPFSTPAPGRTPAPRFLRGLRARSQIIRVHGKRAQRLR